MSIWQCVILLLTSIQSTLVFLQIAKALGWDVREMGEYKGRKRNHDTGEGGPGWGRVGASGSSLCEQQAC
jgi:hypothetical protein